MIFDRDAIADARISDPCPMMDDTGFTENGFTLNVNIRMNHAVTADLRIAADISMRRIDEGHATFAHQASNRLPAHQVFKFGQLCTRVDSRDFARVTMLIDGYRFTAVLENRRR